MTLSPRSSQFSRMDPSKSLSSGALSLMSWHSSRTSTLPTSLPMCYSSSVEMPRTSGSMLAMRLCPTMKILLKLASAQCGLPSLSTTEPLTRLPKAYETFYERLKKPAVRTIVSRNSNPPEIRINATKETKTNAMETIVAMKSPFAPTISSADIQMPNVVTLTIQKD